MNLMCFYFADKIFFANLFSVLHSFISLGRPSHSWGALCAMHFPENDVRCDLIEGSCLFRVLWECIAVFGVNMSIILVGRLRFW